MVFARVVKEKVTTHKSTGKLTKTGIPFGLTVELVNGAACIYSPFVVPPTWPCCYDCGVEPSPITLAIRHLCYVMCLSLQNRHTFSAFWLRSSVVSVLISLISDSESIAFLQD